jgi:parallel beta-helix repeat protein
VDPDNGNYHWSFPSPNNIDAGTPQIPHGSVPPVDIEGNPRPHAGTAPDPGAYEFQGASGVPSTVVTTALDNVNNDAYISLREAIKNANLNGGGRITFNIQGGGCPQTIFLSSPLDPITTPITIDGTTQPGATVNASPDAFDANLCVALVPNGGVANALKVPSNAPSSVSLTVRGVFFGGFSQSIMLLGGLNHLIAGNQFGGTVGGVSFSGSYLNAIAIGGNAVGSLIIGGDNAVDRNVIVGANGPTGDGINIQSNVSGCQIVNNLIGIDNDGVTPHPNTYGINITGGGCDLRANRVGNSTYNGIWVQGDGNVVEQNVVGVAVDGSPAPNGSQSGGTAFGYGINVSGSNNTIGVDKANGFDGQFHANDVRFNAQGGIAVIDGSGNVVRGNVVSSNGIGADGSAMDIDLGGDGITGNLVPNPGTGPNGLQNHPELISLKFIGNPPKPGDTSVPGEVDGIVYGSPGAYKVDIYFAQTGCESDGRGHAESYIASQDVTIPAGATSKTFAVLATIPVYAPLHTLVANQTDAAGNSSELGSCLANDTIFKNGADY